MGICDGKTSAAHRVVWLQRSYGNWVGFKSYNAVEQLRKGRKKFNGTHFG